MIICNVVNVTKKHAANLVLLSEDEIEAAAVLLCA